ncbi:NAD(P)-dependent oxidoreductase [Mesorhizobium sp. M0701]|uniref:NAD(P)-dependent oxidoreductase n=1 Tax=Mesorhizobium sp. M0701 TaxID=2956989 RepID=UPI003339E130
MARLQANLPDWEVVAGAHHDLQVARSADVLVPFAMAVTDDLLSGSRIRLVHQFGVGVDQIDVTAAKRHGVPVCNAPSGVSGMAASVAEGAIFLILSCARLPAVRQKRLETGIWGWATPLNFGLAGRRAGIIGLGDIGRAIAERLRGFGMDLVAVRRDPHKTEESAGCFDWVGGMDRLDELVSIADIIIVTVPLNAETQGLFDKARLKQVKRGASIINVGRGGVINEVALIDELESGRIHAAGLDTIANEPPLPGSKLLDHPNVILTPHEAGTTDTAFDGVSRIIADNLYRLEAGTELRHRVA